MERYIVERTNKAERRPEDQSDKTESCRENLGNETQFERALKTETDTVTESKEWAGSVGLCLRHNP